MAGACKADSAQRAFAETVKSNYSGHCAITGISTREFLVASHIVPWSKAPGIRIDPSNGIRLSTFVDRASDAGFLQIGTDYVVRIDWVKVGDDQALKDALGALRRPACGYANARRAAGGLPSASPCERVHHCPIAGPKTDILSRVAQAHHI
ncbi:HNH endonuclease signature motif containing protein [Arthrobacter sp. EpRS71]|uniref:HNH endonuclease n=1 Tax=Arthrobacter sp. EpRS71 TaxID=1743141 RepID=UPI00074609CC|nr:hypothetical protein AR689_14455 [Arthrobacter sp. EpRS71]